MLKAVEWKAHLTVGELRLDEKVLGEGRGERLGEVIKHGCLQQQNVLLCELKKVKFG